MAYTRRYDLTIILVTVVAKTIQYLLQQKIMLLPRGQIVVTHVRKKIQKQNITAKTVPSSKITFHGIKEDKNHDSSTIET